MRIRHLAVVAVLAGLLGAACGGGDGDSGNGGSSGGELRVSGIEFEYLPDEFTVASGTEIELVFENAGSVEHNWLILRTPIRSEDELTEDNVLFRLDSDPGATARGTFRAPPAGTYQVICDIPGHLSAGMEADLTVTG